jgi:hypothetical protein
MQNYTEGDILLTLKILQTQKIGRKALASRLGLGEATIRTIFRKLESTHLITSTRQGQKITEKGTHYLETHPHFTLPVPVTVETLTLSTYNLASVVCNYAHAVNTGIQFRDAAIISGACGATTLIFSSGKLHFPDTTPLPAEIASPLLNQFSFSENDILIIATAKTNQKAIRGLSGCLSLLSPPP